VISMYRSVGNSFFSLCDIAVDRSLIVLFLSVPFSF
jgi:hypothetical protein